MRSTFFKAIPQREKIYFYQMLSMTLDAGMPLIESLSVVQSKIGHEQFKTVVSGVITQVQKGDSLSMALEKFPVAFQETETTIIKSGEQTGHLQDTLVTLAGSLEATQNVLGKVKNALVYPVTVLIALAIASGFIVAVVIPQLIQIYSTSGATPPASLQTMQWIGNILSTHPIPLLLLAIGGISAVISYFRSKSGKQLLETWLVELPYLSTIYKKTVLARVLRTFSMLTESGLGLMTSLKLLAKVANNHHYARAINAIRRDVERGQLLSTAIEEQSTLFPADISKLIHVGEQTAELGPITRKIATQLERDVEYTLKNITTIIEPAAVIIIGLVVGWFAFLMLGSVFSLTDIV